MNIVDAISEVIQLEARKTEAAANRVAASVEQLKRDERTADRAAVEAGYMSLRAYIEKWENT